MTQQLLYLAACDEKNAYWRRMDNDKNIYFDFVRVLGTIHGENK